MCSIIRRLTDRPSAELQFRYSNRVDRGRLWKRRIEVSYRIPEIALEALLAVAIFAMGAVYQSSHSPQQQQQTVGNPNAAAKNGAAEMSVAEDKIASYTGWLAFFTLALVVVSATQIGFLIRTDKSTTISAEAAKLKATIMLAVESRMPLIVDLKLVEYSHIPGENALAERLLPGPIQPNCRFLLAFENKGRTPVVMSELCIEKFAGVALPRPSDLFAHKSLALGARKGSIGSGARTNKLLSVPQKSRPRVLLIKMGAHFGFSDFLRLQIFSTSESSASSWCDGIKRSALSRK